MNFEFTLENCVVDNSRMFCENKGVPSDAKITLKGSQISNTELFNHLDLPSCFTQLNSQEACWQMTPEEYASIQTVLKERSNKRAFADALFRHLISFAEGVAASIVANCL